MELDAISWAVTEEVDLTLVINDPDNITSTFLVQRRGLADQFVLTFAECAILVNGENVDVTDSRAEALCSLADDIMMNPRGPVVGRKVPARANW